MNKLLLTLLLTFGAGSMLVSCRHSSESVHPLLTYVDSVMEDQPDSALHYLQRLDVSGFSDSDKAYYALLLTQATDKNYLPLLPCDSLVNAALDYYDKGDGLLRAKALLYKGRIQASMNMPQEVMQNCFAGLSELGDAPKELRLKSMLYDDLGGIYQKQFLDDKALDMFRLSYRCDSLLGDKQLLKHSLSNIGWAYVVLDEKKMADEYLNKALALAFEQKDSLFISDLYSRLSDNYENTDSAYIYVRLAQKYQTEADSIKVFFDLGELFLYREELDSAEYYLKKILLQDNFRSKLLANDLLAKLEGLRKNYQKAFEYSLFYSEHTDSIFSQIRASDIEILAYKYEAEANIWKEKVKTERTIQLIVLISIVLLLGLLLIIQRTHRRRKVAKLVYEQTIKHLNKQIALQHLNIERSGKELLLLQQVQQQDKEEITQKEQDIRRMIDEKAKLRNWFFMQTPIYQRIEELAKQEDSNKKETQVLLLTEQQRLKETIMQIYDEYVQYLHFTYPKLTEEDCIYCCLQLCRLDDQTIAYCFGNTSKQIVAQRRLRLKNKMEASL